MQFKPTDPIKGIKGSHPKVERFKSAREAIPVLTENYLELRNRTLLNKSRLAEIELAERRHSLIQKSLVEKQAAYLLVALRQKILSIPRNYARRILGLTEAKQAQDILREMARSVLTEICDLPSKVTDEHWLEKIEADEEREEWREQRREARG